MGYIRHHAIIFTCYEAEEARGAQAYAAGLGLPVTSVVRSPWNDMHSFLVAPDGSKEGWEGSTEGEQQRAEFIAWLKDEVRVRAGARWALVQYGDDEGWSFVVADSEEELRGCPPFDPALRKYVTPVSPGDGSGEEGAES